MSAGFFRWLAVTLMAAIMPLAQSALAQDAPKRSITRIAGDLYRFQNNAHVNVFYVTDDGIIATDPISKDAAAWLKGELASRFDKPVKYVIYSHSDADHASGGEVFADTATFVSHDNAPALMSGFAAAEAMPSETFAERKTIELGGKVVELHYMGVNHTNNSVVMLFPAERALFAVDFINVKRMPFQKLPRFDVSGTIESLKRVLELDFDIMVPGHGAPGVKADVSDHLAYWQELVAGVEAQIAAGATVEQAKSALTLDDYKDWDQYGAWRELNIEGAWAQLSKGG